MARTSKVEACMICGEVPCGCDPKKKPVKSGKKSAARPKFRSSERDYTMEAAMQAIAPLLCSTDRQVYKNMIHPPLHNQRQIEEWRREHGDPNRVPQTRGSGS